jgi:hypothetical protein
MALHGKELSRNPNVCPSCSSMADGLDEVTDSEADCCADSERPSIYAPPLATASAA